VDAVAAPGKPLAVAHVTGLGGTAFAISTGLALTAFHVIGDRRVGDIRHQDVRLQFGDLSMTAHVDPRSAPEADAALLHLSDPLPPGITPIVLSSGVRQGRWSSLGFPADDPSGAGRTIDGNIVDPDQRQPQTGAPVIALYCQQAAAGSPQPLAGFSGAPVLVGPSPRAIGLIRWNPSNPARYGVAEGGTVYACPVRSILARWPELRDLTEKSADLFEGAAEIEHVRQLILRWERNLRTTEIQASQYGSSELPLRLVNQLDNIHNEIRILRERLASIPGTGVAGDSGY
jgi:hypothetical protein